MSGATGTPWERMIKVGKAKYIRNEPSFRAGVRRHLFKLSTPTCVKYVVVEWEGMRTRIRKYNYYNRDLEVMVASFESPLSAKEALAAIGYELY